MEGTILNLNYGYSRMRALGMNPSEIRATGGGAKSGLWLQIAADIFQTPVITLKEQEAAAYGAALQSIWSYHNNQGEKVAIQEIVKDRMEIENIAAEPNRERQRVYQALQKRFNSLWKTLDGEFNLHKKIL